ncbi:MAG: M23 family metallopeptidase [Burkholderiales bacterium]|nr:M23 family metallopeptidase [Burkholderiales bacterium]
MRHYNPKKNQRMKIALFVAQGGGVSKGDQVGTTGVTGFAFGDHTHFEARVQGVAVTPIEWMDPSWIRANILKVQEDAKKIIDGRAINQATIN